MSEFTDFLAAEPVAFMVVAGLVGAIVGSFLNVVIYRLPIMMERQWQAHCREILHGDDHLQNKMPLAAQERFNLLFPSSRCSHCGHKIRPWENIPVISYLLLRGKCSQCGVKIGLRYPLVELVTAIASGYLAFHFGYGAQAFAAILLTWALIALTFIDYDTQLLPDAITLPFIWIGLTLSLGPVFVDSATSILGAVFGYLSLWSVYHLFKLLTGKEGMGYGDFKLLAVLGAWLGWQLLPVIILLSSLVGAFVGITLIFLKNHHKDKPIPFGPYLAVAGWIAMLWGDQMIDMYLSFAGWR